MGYKNSNYELVDWSNWTPTERAVLCFVRKKDEVMLIHKKRGLGAGKINAPGGRLEPEETPAQGAVRETLEETGILPINPRLMGDLSFQFTDGYSLYAKIFVAWIFKGKMQETPEADPFWCKINNIPFKKMWEDDAYWLPNILKGRFISGKFIFDDEKMESINIAVI